MVITLAVLKGLWVAGHYIVGHVSAAALGHAAAVVSGYIVSHGVIATAVNFVTNPIVITSALVINKVTWTEDAIKKVNGIMEDLSKGDAEAVAKKLLVLTVVNHIGSEVNDTANKVQDLLYQWYGEEKSGKACDAIQEIAARMTK